MWCGNTWHPTHSPPRAAPPHCTAACNTTPPPHTLSQHAGGGELESSGPAACGQAREFAGTFGAWPAPPDPPKDPRDPRYLRERGFRRLWPVGAHLAGRAWSNTIFGKILFRSVQSGAVSCPVRHMNTARSEPEKPRSRGSGGRPGSTDSRRRGGADARRRGGGRACALVYCRTLDSVEIQHCGTVELWNCRIAIKATIGHD
eukprot:gene11778-biopygen16888